MLTLRQYACFESDLRVWNLEYQKFELLLKERVVLPILRNPQNEATTFDDMYIEKIKERENVENENVFTIEQMNLVLHDILGAGSETVHASILWAILYLIHYPDIQRYK